VQELGHQYKQYNFRMFKKINTKILLEKLIVQTEKQKQRLAKLPIF
jgi:hypothetical protein